MLTDNFITKYLLVETMQTCLKILHQVAIGSFDTSKKCYEQGNDRQTDRLIALTIPLLHDRRFDRLEDGRMNERTDFNNTD